MKERVQWETSVWEVFSCKNAQGEWMMNKVKIGLLSLLIFLPLVGGSSPTPQGGMWVTLAPMNEPRQEVGVAELNGEIYVVGGFRRNGTTANTVEVYNPMTDTWQFAAPLPVAVNHTTAASVNGKLYVIGGLPTTNLTFEYDPAENVWRRKANMPTARGAHAVAVIDGKIYAVGGSPASAGRDFAVYDPATDTWQPLPPMPTPRNHHAAGVVDGKLYVAGGRNSSGLTLNVLEEYDPATNQWRTRANMPTGRSGIAGAVVDGLFYVFGGEGNRNHPLGVFEQNEAYDPVTDTWVSREPMPTPRHGINAGIIDNRIYLPGGATRQGFGAVGVNEVFIVTEGSTNQ
jgi:N-acetylneuraminic acid mutarotase